MCPNLKLKKYYYMYIYMQYGDCFIFRIFGSVADYFEIQHPLMWFGGKLKLNVINVFCL